MIGLIFLGLSMYCALVWGEGGANLWIGISLAMLTFAALCGAADILNWIAKRKAEYEEWEEYWKQEEL